MFGVEECLCMEAEEREEHSKTSGDTILVGVMLVKCLVFYGLKSS